jgi:hypothetical protein
MDKIKAIEDEARGQKGGNALLEACPPLTRAAVPSPPRCPDGSHPEEQGDVLYVVSAPPGTPGPFTHTVPRHACSTDHLGTLKAKLAKLRRELLEPSKGGAGAGGKGEGFDVTKVGDSRVGLVGFPSVGKSTLLTKLTGTFSEAASYEFTTLTCIPGVIRYRGAKIQLLDLPGIIEGAKDGKGRGRQVISTARTCNLILIVLVRAPA